jgi:hypothetical protein
MFMYFGKGPTGLLTALLILFVAGLLIAGPGWSRRQRLAMAAVVWAIFSAVDLVSRGASAGVAESLAVALALVPAIALGTARTDAVSLHGASASARVTTFFLTGTIGVLLYPLLALILLAVIAHRYI